MPKIEKYAELECIVDAVTASYSGAHEIDNLQTSALPNRRAMVDVLHHLKHSIYMGFYSKRPVTRGNLRYSLSEHLHPAYDMLVEQISRVQLWEQMCCRQTVPRDPDWAEQVVLRLFQKLPTLRTMLNLDVLAAFAGDPAAKSVEEIVFSYPAVQAITGHRIAHELYREQVPMIPRMIAEYGHGETGIDIHPGAQIGRSFFIDHGTGVVIGETCIIGNNVKLYQGVTLGALSLPRDADGMLLRNRKRHPTLEDNVTIYSHSTILGGDTVIGEGSVIGGNMWIVESVPPHSKITFEAQPHV